MTNPSSKLGLRLADAYGLIKLFPLGLQDRGRATLDDAGKALRLWLAAQLVPMVLVSVMIATGAFLIDIPSPLA